MAASVYSSLQQTLYLQPQQNRKFSIEDFYRFEGPKQVKKIKISCHPQQRKRKISIEDCGFEAEKPVAKRRITFKFTPSSLPPPEELSYADKQVETPPAAKRSIIVRLKVPPSSSSIPQPPPPPPPLISNNGAKELSDYNQRENMRLRTLSLICGNTYRNSYFTQKKLCLVLDLDHTLLHSVKIQDVSREEQEYLNGKLSSSTKDLNGDSLFSMSGRYVKLRPYTREFLKEANRDFKLFIYTMGSRDYARDMGRLLDPTGDLFKKNIVSKDDSTIVNRKNLDVLSGPNGNNTIIIDDTKKVWENNRKNLIQIDKYNYFSEDGYTMKKDNEEGFEDEDGALKTILEGLQKVHRNFFEQFLTVPLTGPELRELVKSVDVKPVLKRFRKKYKKLRHEANS
ncbi:hypothetical protein MKW94_030696 [Papaver nudicaule]|uniref:RNA polymerase II C-terminal domain phosphatase-like n=1 Tax=Papaver nudicaule TaxID=74823 RepID=A0AA41W1V1_PAPNU|nr:hypothetical protein [Papaver nudicaule]